MNRKLPRLAPLCLAPLLLAVGLTLAPWTGAAADEAPPAYPVYVDPEVSPRLQAADVARTVREAMERSGKIAAAAPADPEASGARSAAGPSPILSVDCVKGDELATVVGRSSLRQPGATLWVVRARGTFTKSVPGGGTIRNDSGYYVIDDATGLVVAVGSPADRR
jgi:hypothetical protein